MIFQDPYSSLNPRFKVKNIIAEPIKFFQKKSILLLMADIDHALIMKIQKRF